MVIVAGGVLESLSLIIFQLFVSKFDQSIVKQALMARTSCSINQSASGSPARYPPCRRHMYQNQGHGLTYVGSKILFSIASGVASCHSVCRFLRRSMSTSSLLVMGGPQSSGISGGAGPM